MPYGMAQRSWLADWCVAGATAVCRGGMGAHASCRATPVIAWRPTMGDYCPYSPGEAVDACVSQWVLTALAPAALALSVEATTHLEQERQD